MKVWAIALDDFKNGFPLQRKIREILDNPNQRPEIVWQECSYSALPWIPDDEEIQNAYFPAIAVNNRPLAKVT